MHMCHTPTRGLTMKTHEVARLMMGQVDVPSLGRFNREINPSIETQWAVQGDMCDYIFPSTYTSSVPT
jgi:hypothetical protein